MLNFNTLLDKLDVLETNFFDLQRERDNWKTLYFQAKDRYTNLEYDVEELKKSRDEWKRLCYEWKKTFSEKNS